MVNIRDLGLRKKKKYNKNNGEGGNKNRKIATRTTTRSVDTSSLSSAHDHHGHSALTRFLSITLILILASSAAITPYNGSAIFNGIFSIFSIFNMKEASAAGITYEEPGATVCTEATITGQPFPVKFDLDPSTPAQPGYPYTVEFGTLSPQQQALFNDDPSTPNPEGGLIVIATFHPNDQLDQNSNTGSREFVDVFPFTPLVDFVRTPDNTGAVSTTIARGYNTSPGGPDSNHPVDQLKTGAPLNGQILFHAAGPSNTGSFTLTGLKFCAGAPNPQGGPDTFYTALDMSSTPGAVIPPPGGTITIPEDSPGSGSATFRWTIDASNYQANPTINNPNGGFVNPFQWITCDPGVYVDPVANAPPGFTPSNIYEHTFTAGPQPTTVTCDIGIEPGIQYPNGALFELGHSKFSFNVQVTQAQQPPQGPTLCVAPATCQTGVAPDATALVAVRGAGFTPDQLYTIRVTSGPNEFVEQPIRADSSGAINAVFDQALMQTYNFGYVEGNNLVAEAFEGNNLVARGDFTASTTFDPNQQPPQDPTITSLTTDNDDRSITVVGSGFEANTGYLVEVSNLETSTINDCICVERVVTSDDGTITTSFATSDLRSRGFYYSEGDQLQATVRNQGPEPSIIAQTQADATTSYQPTLALQDDTQGPTIWVSGSEFIPGGVYKIVVSNTNPSRQTSMEQLATASDGSPDSIPIGNILQSFDPSVMQDYDFSYRAGDVLTATAYKEVPSEFGDPSYTFVITSPEFAANTEFQSTSISGITNSDGSIHITGSGFLEEHSYEIVATNPSNGDEVTQEVSADGNGNIDTTLTSTNLIAVGFTYSPDQTLDIVVNDVNNGGVTVASGIVDTSENSFPSPGAPTLCPVDNPCSTSSDDGSIHITGTGFTEGNDYVIRVINQADQSMPPMFKTVTATLPDIVDATFTEADMTAVNPDFEYATGDTLRVSAADPIEGGVTYALEDFDATNSFSPAQQPPVVTISSGPTPTTTPKWGIDEIAVSGVALLNGADPATNRLVVDWGDGTTTEFDLSVVPPNPADARAWTITHIYDENAVGARDITAYIVDTSTDPQTVRATSNTVSALVQKHATEITLSHPATLSNTTQIIPGATEPLNTFTADSPLTAIGTLKDKDTGEEISDKPITLVEIGNDGGTTTTVDETGGVTFTSLSSPTIETVLCPTTLSSDGRICTSDTVGSTTNNIMQLKQGDTITFPEGSIGVKAFLQDMGANPVTFTASYYDNSQPDTYTNAGGEQTSVMQYFPAETKPDGIKQIEVTQVGGSGIVGLSSLKISTVDSNPEDITELNFEELPPSSDSPLTLNNGSFFSIFQTQAQPQKYSLQAVYEEDNSYTGSESQVAVYEVIPNDQKGQTGEGSTVVNTNNPLSFSVTQCTADIDNDGICDTWEDNTGTKGVPFTKTDGTAGLYPLCYTDKFTSYVSGSTLPAGTNACPAVGQKDIFLEVDGMAGVFNGDSSSTTSIVKSDGTSTAGPSNPTLRDDSFLAIKKVINAFAAKNIKLHVVVSDIGITEKRIDPNPFDTTTCNTTGTTAPLCPNGMYSWGDPVTSSNTPVTPTIVDSFAEIKRDFFGTGGTGGERSNPDWIGKMDDAKSMAYHYVLFARSFGSSDCSPSGIAEIPGNDMIVSLGCGFLDTSGDKVYKKTEGSVDEQAGTLMHELGHNLNLNHGGPEDFNIADASSTNPIADYSTDILPGLTGATNPRSPTTAAGGITTNCKPNYISVMSYSQQIPGLVPSTKWKLDYSQAPLGTANDVVVNTVVYSKTINEGTATAPALNEGVGIASTTVRTMGYSAVDPTARTPTNQVADTGTTTIDWNGDGSRPAAGTTRLVYNNVNNYGAASGCDGTGSLLRGYEDWKHLRPDFKTSLSTINGFYPSMITSQNVAEMTPEIREKQVALSKQYEGVLQPVNDDGSSIFRIGDTVNIKFNLFNTNGQPISNKPVTFTVQKVSNSITGTFREAASSATPSTTNLFSVSPGPVPTYHYEWGTKGLTQGTYDLRFYVDFGTQTQSLLSNGKSDTFGPYTVQVSLRR